MLAIIPTLFQICLFKAKPQDLPTSHRILIAIILATFVLFMIRNTLLAKEANIIGISIVQVALLGIGLKILLTLFSKSERWLQAATALYGCSSMILLVIIPIILTATNLNMSSDSLSLSKILIIATSFWYFAIIITIFKETLEIGTALAFLITVVLEVSFAIILLKIFGNQIL